MKAQNEKLASSLSVEVDKIVKCLPSSEAITGLSKTLKKVEDSADSVSLFQLVNIVAVVLFVAVVGFCGYNSYYGRTSAENTENMVNMGIYNKDGVSVLQNSKSNAYYWEQKQQSR